ncbi:DHA2 family efflux MFS transporter permease subunit [Tuberibacillus sp. Marseille-P3662]|uniref:DHA2 family efflux MFS transporter permease subunit n=1 Tax=Tuberibacillus sp. Marseille-P3662 TaxID=1965358 RepID=UPI000A1CA6FB|nr:DHA2 family efflux MFS transporter permease subunit [Tuberibacillus sp. Marseille-P3662]
MSGTMIEQHQPIKKAPIIFVMIMGAFVAILNQTLMNVALPVMMQDLAIQANTAQWLTTAYMLVNGVLIPITAFLMERFTTRQLFIAAMSFFATGTLFCAVAPDFPLLLTGRVIQACGAGIMMPLLTNVILSLFPVEKRGSAMGLIGVAMIFAPAVGPTLSGWIVQNYSWRVLFYIVLPIAIIDVILASFLLKNVTQLTKPRIDILSIILSTIGFGGILYGFSNAGNNGWDSNEVMISLAVGAISLIIFITRQLRMKTPMLEFRVFRHGMFSLATVINMVVTMAMFAAMILVPIYLQNIRGFTPLESGLMLLPGAILMGIMSPITGKIFDKIGARWLAVTGLVITLITTWQFSNLQDDTTYAWLIVLYSSRMFGMSMLMMPIMTAGLNALPQKMNAHGTAMVNTMRQIAGSLGTAFLVTVMTNQTKAHLTDKATSAGLSPDTVDKLSDAASSGNTASGGANISAEMQQHLASLAKHAAIQGINDAFMVATGLAGLALVLSFFIKRSKPPEEELELNENNQEQVNSDIAPSKG